MISIVNGSNPPLTQAGDRTYEVYLPAHAKMDSVTAAGPNVASPVRSGERQQVTAAMISATVVPGEPGIIHSEFSLGTGAVVFLGCGFLLGPILR